MIGQQPIDGFDLMLHARSASQTASQVSEGERTATEQRSNYPSKRCSSNADCITYAIAGH